MDPVGPFIFTQDLSLVLILSQMNPMYTEPFYFSYLRLDLPSGLFP